MIGRMLFCGWLWCCLSLASPAQTLSARGTDSLTYDDGTTVAVDLRRDPPHVLGSTIRFRAAGEERERQLGPAAVAGFRYANGRTYRTVEVRLPDRSRGEALQPRLRFGEVLAEGAIEVIKVPLRVEEYDSKAAGNQPYVYLLRTEDMELLLRLTSIVVYEQLHANPARFRNLLKFLSRDCPEAYELATEARFTDDDILRVVFAYADCRQLADLRPVGRRQRPGQLFLHHYLRASVLDMRDADFSNEQFSGGIGYESAASFTGWARRIGVLAGLDYVHHSFRYRDFNVDQSMVKTHLTLAYSPLARPRIDVQLIAGLNSYHAVQSSFGSFFSNNYFMLNGGLRLRHDSFALELSYEHLPGQIDRRPANLLLLAVGYRLPL